MNFTCTSMLENTGWKDEPHQRLKEPKSGLIAHASDFPYAFLHHTGLPLRSPAPG